MSLKNNICCLIGGAFLSVCLSLGFLLLSAPFDWFMIAPDATRAEVYASCGEPHDLSLKDVKGEMWLVKKAYWEWTMLISFKEGTEALHKAVAWVDFALPGGAWRVFFMKNGKIDIHS